MKLGELLEETDTKDISKFLEIIRNEFPKMVDQFVNTRAFFKAKVGESGRVTIPNAEREALEIDEGDLVQVIVKPLEDDRMGDSDEQE